MSDRPDQDLAYYASTTEKMAAWEWLRSVACPADRIETQESWHAAVILYELERLLALKTPSDGDQTPF